MAARVGAWFVGARGSVATTATVGALAMSAGLTARTGCVTELPELAIAGLAGIDELLIGGHDVVDDPLRKRAEALGHAGVLPTRLARALAEELDEVDARIRPGVVAGAGAQRHAVDRLAADLREFRARHALDQVVVVDLSSTEPPLPDSPVTGDIDLLDRALDAGASPLPPSGLYAYAALCSGCPFVAFTPSPGPRLPAIRQLAERERLPYAGSDGKTGETLIKTALAPMFAMRALNVRSWSSVNLLGGGDGRTLADPASAASKLRSKGKGLEAILGHPVSGPMHIDYVPDLDDWKTAWDMVSFEGFLGTRMSLQFTWTGCDSALAAPLVIDLVRLVARAEEVGESGPLGALGFFFKDPIGSDEHDLSEQWRSLIAWCASIAVEGGSR